MLALNPTIELPKLARDVIVERRFGSSSPEVCSARGPLQDYYGSEEHIRVLDSILASNLSESVSHDQVQDLVASSSRRGMLDSADIASHYGEHLAGKTLKELYLTLLALIATHRNAEDSSWIGFHETWTSEFFPAIANAFPEARFIIMFRDPRATIFSNQNARDSMLWGHTLSYARHWRKQFALACFMSSSPALKGRLLVSSHERLLCKPVEELARICQWLDLDFETNLANPETYFDYPTNALWLGNSSFSDSVQNLNPSRSKRWRQGMDPSQVMTIEFFCGYEMERLGYKLEFGQDIRNSLVQPKVLQFLSDESHRRVSWRTDFGSLSLDYGLEVLRTELLMQQPGDANVDLLRECFLFDDLPAILLSDAKPFGDLSA